MTLHVLKQPVGMGSGAAQPHTALSTEPPLPLPGLTPRAARAHPHSRMYTYLHSTPSPSPGVSQRLARRALTWRAAAPGCADCCCGS